MHPTVKILIAFGTLLFVLIVSIFVLTYLYWRIFQPPKGNPYEYVATTALLFSTKKRLVCIGDSLTHGNMSVDYVKILSEKLDSDNFDVINAGINAELTYNVLQRLDSIIACKPDLLIADEPTTALVVTIQNQILKLFKDLRAQYQTSMLFITHDLGIISKMCDRVAVMYSGYIVEYGIIKKLFKTPYHPYTRALLASIPNVKQKREELSIIPGMVPNLIFPPSGCRFHPRCSYCFEPCDSNLPKGIEIEPNYYVACHLYDPKYREEAKRVIDRFESENKNMEVI